MEVWRQIQQKNFTKIADLAAFLDLDLKEQRSPFPLNLPYRLAEKIEKGRLDDPLLIQFLPTQLETAKVFGFKSDPVEDQLFQKSGKLLQKYQGRALLITT